MAESDDGFPRSSAGEFDLACQRFTEACNVAANWKHNYFGSVYSTRIESAISDLRVAIANMEYAIELDRSGEGRGMRATARNPTTS